MTDMISTLKPGPTGFRTIGSTFSVAGKSFYGEAIASGDAIYLVLRTRRNDLANAAGGAVGGLIGGAIAGALLGGLGNNIGTSITVVTAEALPEAVRKHETWPVKKLKPTVEIVVVPKAAIAPPGIVHPKWGNLLLMNIADKRVKIEYRLFQGAATRSFLERAKWPLVWGGSAKLLKPAVELSA